MEKGNDNEEYLEAKMTSMKSNMKDMNNMMNLHARHEKMGQKNMYKAVTDLPEVPLYNKMQNFSRAYFWCIKPLNVCRECYALYKYEN